MYFISAKGGFSPLPKKKNLITKTNRFFSSTPRSHPIDLSHWSKKKIIGRGDQPAAVGHGPMHYIMLMLRGYHESLQQQPAPKALSHHKTLKWRTKPRHRTSASEDESFKTLRPATEPATKKHRNESSRVIDYEKDDLWTFYGSTTCWT